MLSNRALMLSLPATLMVLVPASIPTGRAAEIQLRDQCRASGTLVRLRDVAVIIAADDEEAERLGAIDLMPAPIPGSKRRLRAREIEDLLRSRGVNLTDHRFSGAARIVVLPPGKRAAVRKNVRPSRLTTRRLRTKVQAGITARLREASGRDEPWRIDIELTDEQVSLLAAVDGDCVITGGAAPWIGRQRFEIVLPPGSRMPRLPLAANVSLPPALVIAVRSLAPGTVLHATDVRSVRDSDKRRSAVGGRESFHTIDEVIGMETTRSVVAGQQLDKTVLRHPLLVRRGDIVTVYARTGGIQVRTTARARDDASAGELVMVESVGDRKRYFARVTGTREVDVFAGSTRIEEPAARDRGSAAETGRRQVATHGVRPESVETRRVSYQRK
ncbi:MAG: flagellar basal body P-ring formation chaperone FlgA [Pirellulales bacterium]